LQNVIKIELAVVLRDRPFLSLVNPNTNTTPQSAQNYNARYGYHTQQSDNDIYIKNRSFLVVIIVISCFVKCVIVLIKCVIVVIVVVGHDLRNVYKLALVTKKRVRLVDKTFAVGGFVEAKPVEIFDQTRPA
jgi:hypothetical protein